MLPRTDLIVSYKPLPHVARSAIIKKLCFVCFCTRESREIIVRWKLEPRSREFIAKNQGRKSESLLVDLVDVYY